MMDPRVKPWVKAGGGRQSLPLYSSLYPYSGTLPELP
jgi:hypothetical protein